MSILHLLWIVPLSAAIGLAVMAIIGAGKCADCRAERWKENE